ncbi:MAG: ABC transporter ATP-binding protein [Chloroflexi bacterium]|nr:ABC transporter ATP-binding protein [Chloroflexota bacterium]
MPEVAITAEHLGKRFRLGRDQDPYGRLSEVLSGIIRAPFGRQVKRTSATDFWALRDVSFEIEAGSAVGIIGRNGAGKSTLLKILSRITSPTSGTATLHGRIASLLEVGTGFHPELSGTENIYLSGAVLGMRRAEIRRNFDEIVNFSGIDPQFLDTPVKRYSSGMQVRLGFAVAAHLESEILLVDEVLAVGDANFQAKCIGKMSEIGRSGRTVLFVSHSMPAVLRLCSRVILLDGGSVVSDGPSHAAIRRYLESDLGRTSERRWDAPDHAPGDTVARLRSVRVVAPRGGSAEEVDIRQPVEIEVEYWVLTPSEQQPTANLAFWNDAGVCLFISNDWRGRDVITGLSEPTLIRSTCTIPGNFLAEGRVLVTVAVSTFNPPTAHAIERDAIAFHVIDRSEGDGVRGDASGEWPGAIRPLLEWRTILPAD